MIVTFVLCMYYYVCMYVLILPTKYQLIDIKNEACNRLNDYFYKTEHHGHLLTFVLNASDSVFLSLSHHELLG